MGKSKDEKKEEKIKGASLLKSSSGPALFN